MFCLQNLFISAADIHASYLNYRNNENGAKHDFIFNLDYVLHDEYNNTLGKLFESLEMLFRFSIQLP